MMNELFSKTFSELTTAAPLDIRGLGDKPLTVCQLTRNCVLSCSNVSIISASERKGTGSFGARPFAHF